MRTIYIDIFRPIGKIYVSNKYDLSGFLFKWLHSATEIK